MAPRKSKAGKRGKKAIPNTAVEEVEGPSTQEEVPWRWKWGEDRNWDGRVNGYSKYKLIHDILTQLTACGKLDEFKASCFGHFLQFDPDAFLCGKALIQLINREIEVPNAPSFEHWFRIGGKSLRFSKLEFCMITGLKFGASTFDPESPGNEPAHDGLYQRLFHGQSVGANELWGAFSRGHFIAIPDDALKVAYILVASIILYGADGRGSILHWMWTLVEDSGLFNSFPWGTYTFQRLCHYLDNVPRHISTTKHGLLFHLYGFPMALQLWAYECIPDLGEKCGSRLPGDNRLPRGVRWKCPMRTLDLTTIFTSDVVLYFKM